MDGYNGKLFAGGYQYGTVVFGQYNIVYYSTGPGVIAYEVWDLDTGCLVPEPSPYAERALEENRKRAAEYKELWNPVLSFDKEAFLNGLQAVGSAVILCLAAYYGGPVLAAGAGKLLWGN